MKKNHKVKIQVETSSPFKILKYLKNFNINIYNIEYQKNKITLIVDSKNLKNINKITKYRTIKEYTLRDYISSLNKTNILIFILIIILITILTRINIRIDIMTENSELKRKISNDLDKLEIKPYILSKSDSKLSQIKENLLKQNKDTIEWLNIEKIGMTYIINIEQKITKNPIKEQDYCNVVSKKDGIISRIYPKKGVVLKEVNEYVKKDEVIISGDITYNDEIKSQVCASGTVYAKIWYKINISIPKTYEVLEKKAKKRNNYEIHYNNQTIKIFKSRVNNPITTKKKIINLFGIKIYKLTETEGEKVTKEYTKEEINGLIDNLIEEKMSNQVEGKLNIISQKVLKKEEKNSTIEEELFIVVEEPIGIKR